MYVCVHAFRQVVVQTRRTVRCRDRRPLCRYIHRRRRYSRRRIAERCAAASIVARGAVDDYTIYHETMTTTTTPTTQDIEPINNIPMTNFIPPITLLPVLATRTSIFYTNKRMDRYYFVIYRYDEVDSQNTHTHIYTPMYLLFYLYL